MFNALAHDYVLRRNVRVNLQSPSPSDFLSSSHGCHHLRLVSKTGQLWNALVQREAENKCNNDKVMQKLHRSTRPVQKVINSGETFGLVSSESFSSFDGLFTFDSDPDDINKDAVLQLASDLAAADTHAQSNPHLRLLEMTDNALAPQDTAATTTSDLVNPNIDPALLRIPLEPSVSLPSHYSSSTVIVSHTVVALCLLILTSQSSRI